jgi:cbb3-type cytochrome oxidase subunit 3
LLHFEWKWDSISLDGLDSNVITLQLALLEENGLFQPTLSDLHKLKLYQKQGIHWWTTLANFMGNAVMMDIFFITVVYLAFRFHRFRQTQKEQVIPARDENLYSDSQKFKVCPALFTSKQNNFKNVVNE